MTRPSAATFEDVTLETAGQRVLSNVTLAIAEGEFVGVLGPNGAGKTTLMRSLLGLAPASHGSICVLGRPVSRGNINVGYMPQLRATPTTMRLSGWDFVASVVNGHRFGLPIVSKAQRAEIHNALELVDATALAQRPLNEMSGGERQRLLLAQTLIGAPQLLLLDEPLNSLDPHRANEMLTLIKRVQTQLGIAVLVSAHDLNQMLGVMDKVLYLARGQAALGRVDEVMTTPVLSRLYGARMEVVRAEGHIFVAPGTPAAVATLPKNELAVTARHLHPPEARHYA
jgi:zinc/manganese transport system ATP-binding protein